jgi:hypothetical protein
MPETGDCILTIRHGHAIDTARFVQAGILLSLPTPLAPIILKNEFKCYTTKDLIRVISQFPNHTSFVYIFINYSLIHVYTSSFSCPTKEHIINVKS